MIVTFNEIINDILTQMGKTTETAETTVTDSIKLRINQTQEDIWYRHAYEWRKQRWYFSSRAPIMDGTITVTKGSKSVTGSGTSFTDVIKLGYLYINNKNYKVDYHSTVTTTSFKLMAAYPDATESGAAYQIIFPDYILDPEIAGIINIFHEDQELDVKNSNRLILTTTSLGIPSEVAAIGRLPFTYSNVGTVNMTNSSTAVVGAGTAFSSEMEGMPFRVDEFSEVYTIQSVASAGSMTLKQAYKGATGSGKTYKVAPEGSHIIQLRNTPDDIYFFEIEGLSTPRKLVDATDISLIPNHDALLKGSIWLAYKEIDKKPVNHLQDAKQTYEMAITKLKNSAKVLTNVKWQSEAEIAYRKQTLNTFNPLNL